MIVVITILSVLIGLALIFSLVRMVKGPTPFDRVLALDAFNIVVTGLIVLIAHIKKNDLFLDVALIYAILAFLETIAFARFLERRAE